MRIGGLPITVARGDEWFVLPADGMVKSAPIGGPFPNPSAARWFVVEYLETTLTEAQRELWQRVMERHTPTTDAGHELGLIDMVKHGRTFEQIAPYLQRARHGERRQVDRRMAAAGEKPEAA